jgi:hypothetical protein
MKKAKRTQVSLNANDAQQLIASAARQGVILDPASAKSLAPLGTLAATRKLTRACRLLQAGHYEDIELSPRDALRRIDACGGDVEEAIRRMLTGGPEARAGIPEAIQYAADRGVLLAPSSVCKLFTKHGASGTRHHIDKLAAVMDAASILGIDCTQTLATRRLSLAEGNAQRVIADFAAEHRRRSDRRTITCRVTVPPRELRARGNAFAGCGCARCLDRLATQMQHYIGKMIAGSFFAGLDREEARAEANLELIRSVETWPGGNFTGWFAARFKNRVNAIYSSRSAEERAMLSLDATDVLSDDVDGRSVPLGERIPDRSVDVLTIVLLRERFAEAALELRQLRADRSKEFTNGLSAKPELSILPPWRARQARAPRSPCFWRGTGHERRGPREHSFGLAGARVAVASDAA